MIQRRRYFGTRGTSLDKELCDICESWEDTLETLSNELIEAGVRKDFSDITASFLYNMYLRKIPIIIAGPAGRSMADALSSTLFAESAFEFNVLHNKNLDDEDLFYDDLVNLENKDVSDVVSVRYGLEKTDFIDFLVQRNSISKHLIIDNPFAEDLMIEPRSLYTYIFPFISDVIIDHLPTERFVGGIESDGYIPFESSGKERVSSSAFKELNIPQLMTNRLLSVLADIKEQRKVNHIDVMYLFCLFPYAYVTGQMSVMKSLLDKETGLSKAVAEQISLFIS